MSDGAVDLNLISIAVSRVKVFSETGAHLSDATGFFIGRDDRTFFVTAWHVLSGRNFHSKKHLHPSGALPSYVTLTFWGSRDVTGTAKLAEFQFFHDLIRLGELESVAENPKNLHPKFGHDVDVIAIEITPLASVIRQKVGFDIKAMELADEQLRPINVMDQVFIPGYPVIKTQKPNDMAIYKAATIASEPHFFQGVPCVLVDGKTKKGWSGSPVIRKIPVHKPKDRSVLLHFEQFALYAIYSGRDGHDEELISAELGYCWPVHECLVPILNQL